MAGCKIGCLSLVLLMIVLILISSNGVWGGSEEVDFAKLCMPYVGIKGVARRPSLGCCNALRGLDIVKSCSNVPPEIEHYISMQKFINAARSCRIRVPRGLKCGSYTVPRRL